MPNEVFTDEIMLVVTVMFLVTLLAELIGFLRLHHEDWFWAAAKVPPAAALVYYYFILFLDPEIPERQIPGDILTALYRPALSWLLIVISTHFLLQLVSAWRVRRRLK